MFPREVFLTLPYFDHMHRYLPAIVGRDGWRTLHVDVAHAPRHAGRSNYANLGRALVGVSDLVGRHVADPPPQEGAAGRGAPGREA